MLDLYLLRHIESEANCNHHLIGGRSNHTPPTNKGEAQGRLLGKRIADKGITFTHLYSSPAVRTRRTAGIVGEEAGFTLDSVQEDDDLQEIHQGDWEGRNRAAIYTPEQLAVINADNWNFRPPRGESQRDVEERVLGFLDKEGLLSYDGKAIVGIFGHGFSFKCLLRGVLNSSPQMTYKIEIANASITRVQFDKHGWHVVCVNDIGHLGNLVTH